MDDSYKHKILNLNDGVVDILKDATDITLKYTLQFFAINIKEKELSNPEFIATGVLVRSNSGFYILSAGHIVKSIQGRQVAVLLDRSFHILNTEKIKFVDPEESETDNITDLFLYTLSEEEFNLITNLGKSFYNLERKNLNQTLIDIEQYLVLGFPISKTKEKGIKDEIRSTALAFLSKPADKKFFNLLHYNEEINHLIYFRKRSTIMADTGSLAISPNLQGMSGGGLWYLPDFKIERGKEIPHLLVGILIEHYQEYNVLAFTKIGQVKMIFNI